jgi:hypothetical protein
MVWIPTNWVGTNLKLRFIHLRCFSSPIMIESIVEIRSNDPLCKRQWLTWISRQGSCFRRLRSSLCGDNSTHHLEWYWSASTSALLAKTSFQGHEHPESANSPSLVGMATGRVRCGWSQNPSAMRPATSSCIPSRQDLWIRNHTHTHRSPVTSRASRPHSTCTSTSGAWTALARIFAGMVARI